MIGRKFLIEQAGNVNNESRPEWMRPEYSINTPEVGAWVIRTFRNGLCSWPPAFQHLEPGRDTIRKVKGSAR
jgi:hypothetical protein